MSTLNDFVDDGGNVLAGADSSIGEPMREFAAEYDELVVSVQLILLIYGDVVDVIDFDDPD